MHSSHEFGYRRGSLMPMQLVTAEEMRVLDRLAIDTFGIPSFTLMRRAAAGAAEMILRRFNRPQRRQVLVVAGKGNNGGDAMVCARLLATRRTPVTVALAARPEDLKGDAARAYKELRRAKVQVIPAVDPDALRRLLHKCTLVVDGLLGTGLNAPVVGYIADLIGAMNESGKPVAALDVPSGLDANVGVPLGTAVHAQATATFGFAKLGLVTYPGRAFAGDLTVIDIGIPPEAVERVQPRSWQIEPADVRRRLLVRPPTAHKGICGHVLVIGGTAGHTGAALMAAEAAARVGAGLTTLAGPASLNAVLAAHIPEVMTALLPDDQGRFRFDPAALTTVLDGKTAVVIGPGMGTTEDSALLVRFVLEKSNVPVVCDADALNCIARSPEVLRLASGRCVLTPHPGEMARLTGLSTVDVLQRRPQVAREFATRNRCVLVLKGATSLVVAEDGALWVNPTGNPGMASGGMGDVLAGVIGGLLAQGLRPIDAAIVGVFAHGAAADSLARQFASVGYLATEVAKQIPRELDTLRVAG